MDKNKINLLSSCKNAGNWSQKLRLISACLILLMVIGLIVPGCNSDKVGDTYYTFKGETIGGYLQSRPETYSEFTQLLELTGTMGLLKAYGEYTCFVPDNEAMYNFYQAKGKGSLADFPIDTLTKIVQHHIIKGYAVTSDEFVEGFLPYKTMSGRYLSISLGSDEQGPIYNVNVNSTIAIRDVEVHNGVIQTIDAVISPTENTLDQVISADDKFSLFYDALVETGLYEKLTPVKDDNYQVPADLVSQIDGTYSGIGGLREVPKERKYGFTALIESNDTYAAAGITNLDELKAYAKSIYDPAGDKYPEADRDSICLNRFVAYHLINKWLPSQFFIEKYDNTGKNGITTHSVKDVDMFEYIEPMCPNTLIEVRTLRASLEYNVFNMTSDNDAIRLTDDTDNDAVNGVYHEIDHILAYTPEVESMLSTKRLRMDAASFLPELTNNNMRVGHANSQLNNEEWWFPDGYFDRLKTAPGTQFIYIAPDDRFCDYQGDEIFLSGLYEFEIKTPPVPAGTYEVRFGYQPTIYRGVAQLFWDNVPCGIPLDLSIYSNDPRIGSEVPGTNADDPYGYENDKMMRNRGYMKGPASYKVIQPDWYSGENARYTVAVLRRILGIYTFDETTNHTFKVVGKETGQFMFDYLEFVPVEVLPSEDIY